jgi:hypothetical protein
MGRHGPPTNRSLYLSVAASTLRFAIIVALVVGGVVLIDQAFPEATTADGTGGLDDNGGIQESVSPTPPPDQNGDGQDGQEEPGGEQPTAPTAGTMIVVFNASGESDLAGATQDELIRRFAY